MQFLDFLTSNFCKPFLIKPLSEAEQKNPMIEKIQGKIKNIYSCQEKSLIALDFNGQNNITEIKISSVLDAINETNSGLEFEVLVIVDNDTNPTQTNKKFNKILSKLKEKAKNNEKDKYQLKSTQILTLPNETSPGCLESLIIEICPKENFHCFDGLISCLEKSSSVKIPNENTIAKLKLNYYNTFFNDEDKKNVSTSIENILKNTQKQYEKEKKDFLSHIKQNQNIKNIIEKISAFIKQ